MRHTLKDVRRERSPDRLIDCTVERTPVAEAQTDWAKARRNDESNERHQIVKEVRCVRTESLRVRVEDVVSHI